MSLSTNKAFVKSFVEEVFNKHDISADEKYFACRIAPDVRIFITRLIFLKDSD
jgi:hypothetical protein